MQSAFDFGLVLFLTIQQGWLIWRCKWIRFVTVIQAVGNILWRQLRARHGVRPVKIDATHFWIQRQGFGHGGNVQRLNGLVIVQRAAKLRGAAFAVVGRGPVAHVVGVLGVAVVKHGIVWPRVVGRHVRNAAGGFNRVVQQRLHRRGHRCRRQSKPFSPIGLMAHLQPVTHEREC